MKRTIKLEMSEYKHRPGCSVLTEQEKKARLYALAEKLGVQIGGKDGRTERNSKR